VCRRFVWVTVLLVVVAGVAGCARSEKAERPVELAPVAGGTPPGTPKVDLVRPLRNDPLKSAPGVFFHEDLETLANLRDRFQDANEADGHFGISNKEAFSGSRSLEQRYGPGQAEGWVWRQFGDNPHASGIRDRKHYWTVVARWYHKFEEGFTPRDGKFFPQKMARMRCFNGQQWMGAYTVLFWFSGPDAHMSIERHTFVPDADRPWPPSHFANWYFSRPENVGRWIHFELRVAVGPEKHSDRIQAWADGILVCDIENDDTAAGYREFGLNGMSWDTYWAGNSPREQSRFYDDLVLSTRPIGPARTPLNPVIVKSPFSDPDRGDHQTAWQVEVARAVQRPLVPAEKAGEVVTRYQPYRFDYTTVWQGITSGPAAAMVVDARNGTFVGPLVGKDRLEPNTLYMVRLRQKDAVGNWSPWSNWHAGFATTWARGTKPEQRTPPRGYLLSWSGK